MATIPMQQDSHSTTQQGSWSTRRIAITALLCAVSAVCTLVLEFPILPGVTWLKYDPSGIVALVAGLAYGPATAAVVSVIPYLVHLATQSGIYGVIMAVLATFALAVPAAAIYQRNHTMRGAIAGLVVGSVVSVAACIVGNLIVTPLYAGMALDDVVALIVPALLPFNVLKVCVNSVVSGLILRPVSRALGVAGPNGR